MYEHMYACMHAYISVYIGYIHIYIYVDVYVHRVQHVLRAVVSPFGSLLCCGYVREGFRVEGLGIKPRWICCRMSS